MTGGTPVPPGKELLVGSSLAITKAAGVFREHLARLKFVKTFSLVRFLLLND
jgi:hypothetical protein